MNPQFSPIAPVQLPPVPVPSLAYYVKPTARQRPEKRPKVRRGAPCQTWNVVQRDIDRGISSKGAEMARLPFAKAEFLDFRISMTPGRLSDIIAYIAQPTIGKTPKNSPIQTPTTENTLSLESTRYSKYRHATKAGISFEIGKTDQNAPKKLRKCQTWNLVWNQRHDRKRGARKGKNSAPWGAGMSCKINNIHFREAAVGPQLTIK